jgi:hypothetical protein
MGILDVFGGEKGRDTSIWSAGNTQAGANRQRSYLGTGATQSLAALGRGYNQGRKDVTGQYAPGLRHLNDARISSLAAINRNPDIIRQYGANADSYYAPLGEEANRGFSTYGDAAGINGGAGQDRARANFRAGPGYEFMLGQGINAATRAANAAGMTASGNTMQAAQKLGSGLADQQWDDYMAHLAPYLNLAPQIAAKRADIQTGMSDDLTANNTALAGLYTGYGKDAAALRMGQGNTLASLATGYGSNQSNIYTGLGTNLSNVTGAETAAITGQGQAGMLAGQQGNANALNFGMQAANLAAGQAPKIIKAFA